MPIGSKVPKALEALDVIRSVGDGPYAVKTALGRPVNGPLGETQVEEQEEPQITVNRIFGGKLDELWNLQFKKDFPECARDDKDPSKEDKQFLDKVSNIAKLLDGHYYIGLSFKDTKFCMPDNRTVARQHLQNLKQKLIENLYFLQDYNNFMSDISLKVMQRAYQKTAWKALMAENGTYHTMVSSIHKRRQKKSGVRLWARYHGVLLNSQLLQGPDITNTLIGILTRFRK